MTFLLIYLILHLSYYFCNGSDVVVFYTKHDQDNIVLRHIRENYVANFNFINERKNYCPNFDEVIIAKNNVCTLPVIFYPYQSKITDDENNCSFKKYLKKNSIKINYLYNYMEVKHENNTWIISATKKDQKYKSVIIESAPNFYYNIQMGITKIIDFVEEQHFHECKTKKQLKRVAFISQLSSDFVVISRVYFICIIVVLLIGFLIGLYLLIRHLITRTNQIKNESLV